MQHVELYPSFHAFAKLILLFCCQNAVYNFFVTTAQNIITGLVATKKDASPRGKTSLHYGFQDCSLVSKTNYLNIKYESFVSFDAGIRLSFYTVSEVTRDVKDVVSTRFHHLQTFAEARNNT